MRPKTFLYLVRDDMKRENIFLILHSEIVLKMVKYSKIPCKSKCNTEVFLRHTLKHCNTCINGAQHHPLPPSFIVIGPELIQTI